MTSADDLRTALPTCWYCPNCNDVLATLEGPVDMHLKPGGGDEEWCREPMVEVPLLTPAVLGDPVRRLAILFLIGDVRDGYLRDWCVPVGRRPMGDDLHVVRLLGRALYTAIIEVRPEYTPGAAAKMADGLARELAGRTDLFTVRPRAEAAS